MSGDTDRADTPNEPVPPKLGILAGGGGLPRRIAEVRRDQGAGVLIVAFKGQTDPGTVEGFEHVWHRLGGTSETIKALHEAGCGEVVMAGPMRRPAFSEMALDARSAMALMRAGSKVFGDDGLLSVIVAELEREGFAVIGIDDVLGGMLAPQGLIAGPGTGADALTEAQAADVARGLSVLAALGDADVGQSVAIQQGLVLAVEAIEGTDAMIRRAGELKRAGVGGPILIKGLKPGQEGRADRPTIGEATVRAAAEAGFSGIVVQADAVMVVDRDAMRKAARETGVFVRGMIFEEAL
jgi:hypothetical protein